MTYSAGRRLRDAIQQNNPLKIPGAINAYSALLAERAGHKALYLSGAGVANASMGLPDLAITTMQDVLTDVYRITAVTELPLLVDIDTGWGSSFNIARTIKSMEKGGVAGVHIEDQVAQKRCGHRPNKELVDQKEMVDRIKAAVDARGDDNFVIMARTDALASEGVDAAIARVQAYVAAGANAIFPEALTSLEQYRKLCEATPVPVLANITEFGATPLFSASELADAGIAMVLYPLSAFRAMAKAAEGVYTHLANEEHQQRIVDDMQTREQLYETLGYYEYEKKVDQLFSQSKNKEEK